MKKTMKICASAALLAMAASAAFAVEATNNGSEPKVLLVTEQGSRSEVSIAAGQTVMFCDAGCFVTLPNGDRHALTGEETLEITNDQVLIK